MSYCATAQVRTELWKAYFADCEAAIKGSLKGVHMAMYVVTFLKKRLVGRRSGLALATANDKFQAEQDVEKYVGVMPGSANAIEMTQRTVIIFEGGGEVKHFPTV